MPFRATSVWCRLVLRARPRPNSLLARLPILLAIIISSFAHCFTPFRRDKVTLSDWSTHCAPVHAARTRS